MPAHQLVDTLSLRSTMYRDMPEKLTLQLSRMAFGFNEASFRAEASGRNVVIAHSIDTGEHVGYAVMSSGLRDNAALIHYIAVAPKLRGNGVGKQIIQYCAEEAKKAGAEALITHPAGEAAERFFGSCGFTESPRSATHIEMPLAA